MATQPLPRDFASRDELVDHVSALAPWAAGGTVSPIRGGRAAAEERLSRLDPVRYGRTRNHLDGAVTGLSPYIRHGIVSPSELRDRALERAGGRDIERFLQQVAWRDFWQRIYVAHPEWIWNDVEAYKTGVAAEDYARELPTDVTEGRTGVACLDQFIGELIDTGYLHNHARMYLASYVCHWRRVRWQTGAEWFLHHLLDGDPASNNLSWQWVASTFSNKPYIFNLENVRKYASEDVDTSPAHNRELDATYDELNARLFPGRPSS